MNVIMEFTAEEMTTHIGSGIVAVKHAFPAFLDLMIDKIRQPNDFTISDDRNAVTVVLKDSSEGNLQELIMSWYWTLVNNGKVWLQVKRSESGPIFLKFKTLNTMNGIVSEYDNKKLRVTGVSTASSNVKLGDDFFTPIITPFAYFYFMGPEDTEQKEDEIPLKEQNSSPEKVLWHRCNDDVFLRAMCRRGCGTVYEGIHINVKTPPTCPECHAFMLPASKDKVECSWDEFRNYFNVKASKEEEPPAIEWREGDSVWWEELGAGVIMWINTEAKKKKCVHVQFPGKYRCNFTLDGKYFPEGNRSLFFWDGKEKYTHRPKNVWKKVTKESNLPYMTKVLTKPDIAVENVRFLVFAADDATLWACEPNTNNAIIYTELWYQADF